MIDNIIESAVNSGLKSSVILDSFYKADTIINQLYNKPLCSISGGSDSDIVLDLISKVDKNRKVTYVWFDTGLEYEATKRHLKYLEDRYNVTIHREKAIIPIPLSVKKFGQPFVSKYASEMIERLQRNNFKFEDKSYEELIKEYPNCKTAIKWWCNRANENLKESSMISRYNIEFNRALKEFMIKNPPKFKISSKCCEYAKKAVNKELLKRYECDISIVGVRKYEGGIRSTVYDGCHTRSSSETDSYRPIFWYKKSDKEEYNKVFNIVNSDCYTKWKFTRTGCVCCPYGKDLDMELVRVEKYEPKMYKAVTNIFKESYEYRELYKQEKVDDWRERHGYKRVFTKE